MIDMAKCLNLDMVGVTGSIPVLPTKINHLEAYISPTATQVLRGACYPLVRAVPVVCCPNGVNSSGTECHAAALVDVDCASLSCVDWSMLPIEPLGPPSVGDVT